jgi:hypothetical protein
LADKGLANDGVRTEPNERGAIAVIPPKADRKTAILCDFANLVGATRSKPSFVISSNGAGSQQSKIAWSLVAIAAVMVLRRVSSGPNEKLAAEGQEGDCNLPRSRVN